MTFLEFKRAMENRLVQLCKDKIIERGGEPGQVIITDSEDLTSIKVCGTITEVIEVPVRLCGCVTTLDNMEIANK